MIWETENFSMFRSIAAVLICLFWPDMFPAARRTTLKFHQGFVKGLAFDPAGELLASQVRLDGLKPLADRRFLNLVLYSPTTNPFAFGRPQTGHLSPG